MSTATATAAESAPRRRVHRASPLTVGTIVFLASECMFFSALFAVYFTLKAINLNAGTPWPPDDVHLKIPQALVFTIFLVLSSGTMQMAVRAIQRGDKKSFQHWVMATAFLGIAFVANQLGFEWREADFKPTSHAFGSLFFTMTGFHAAHVTGGIIAMAVLLARSGAKRFSNEDTPSVEVVSYYWHFVDVVWVIMFSILFFIQ